VLKALSNMPPFFGRIRIDPFVNVNLPVNNIEVIMPYIIGLASFFNLPKMIACLQPVIPFGPGQNI